MNPNTLGNLTERAGEAVQRLLGETVLFNDYGDGAPYWMGTASTMHHDDQPTDPVAELHKIVE